MEPVTACASHQQSESNYRSFSSTNVNSVEFCARAEFIFILWTLNYRQKTDKTKKQWLTRVTLRLEMLMILLSSFMSNFDFKSLFVLDKVFIISWFCFNVKLSFDYIFPIWKCRYFWSMTMSAISCRYSWLAINPNWDSNRIKVFVAMLVQKQNYKQNKLISSTIMAAVT